jgi:hypothetical protein
VPCAIAAVAIGAIDIGMAANLPAASMSERYANLDALRTRVAMRLRQLAKEQRAFSWWLCAPESQKWLSPLPSGVTFRQLLDEANASTEELQADLTRLKNEVAVARTARDNAVGGDEEVYLDRREAYYHALAAMHDAMLAILCQHMAMLYRERQDAQYYIMRYNDYLDHPAEYILVPPTYRIAWPPQPTSNAPPSASEP